MRNSKYIIVVFLLIVIVSILPIDAIGQCPMCRMAAESNLQNGGTEAKGLNNGILYMLAMPYLLIGTLAFLWYRNRRKGSERVQQG